MNNPLKNIHSGKTSIENTQFTQKYSWSYSCIRFSFTCEKTSIENGQFPQKYSYAHSFILVPRDIPWVFVSARKGQEQAKNGPYEIHMKSKNGEKFL